MPRAILVLACLLVIALPVTSQRKPSKLKPKLDPYFDPPRKESPGGVPIRSYDDFLEELKVEWRPLTASKQSFYFYSTRRVACNADNRILSGWIKELTMRKENQHLLCRATN